MPKEWMKEFIQKGPLQYTCVKIKSWTKLFMLHFMLMPLGKAWIHMFSPLLWLNSRADKVLQSCLSNLSRKRKTESNPSLLHLKIDLVFTSILWQRNWVNTYMCVKFLTGIEDCEKLTYLRKVSFVIGCV